MAEENSNPVFQIQRMYLKDLSLEIPHAPHSRVPLWLLSHNERGR